MLLTAARGHVQFGDEDGDGDLSGLPQPHGVLFQDWPGPSWLCLTSFQELLESPLWYERPSEYKWLLELRKSRRR
jgi:hypothetical protein